MPLPSAWSISGTLFFIWLITQGYSGAYFASNSAVGRAVLARWMMLSELACRKVCRSTAALVIEP